MRLVHGGERRVTALMLWKKLVSTTRRMSWPCALRLASSTEVTGTVPKRFNPSPAPAAAPDQQPAGEVIPVVAARCRESYTGHRLIHVPGHRLIRAG
jgi:hypothetical protein